jgi:very-short-patch-repair endonuclease
MVMKRTIGFGRGSNDVEARLWAKLREFDELGYRFRRKAPFKSFILDFVEHDALLVVELDDGQPGQPQSPNVARDHMLREAGYTVLRFWKSEAAHDLAGVISSIRRVLEDRPPAILPSGPSGNLPPQGGKN